MRQSSGKLNMKHLFLLLQAILYVAFLILDLTSNSNNLSIIIKYTLIVVCFLYTLLPDKEPEFNGRNHYPGKGLYKSTLFCLRAALFFTVIADLFILILDYYLYGVVAFIIVQQFYSARLVILIKERNSIFRSSDDRNDNLCSGNTLFFALVRQILLQLFITVIVCTLLMLYKVTTELLLVASVFYFICILSNVITAFYIACKDLRVKANLLYAIGMLLFLLCDINVGLFNLSGFIAMPEEVYSVIYSFSAILMWTFYAPSQVLIALSSRYISLRK